MKTKILLAFSFLLLMACSEDNEVEPQLTKEAQITLDIIESENNDTSIYPITQKEMETLQNELSNNHSRARRNCAQETIVVYWNGAAETDFALRQYYRDLFMQYHGLDTVLRPFPESVRNDSELWIFYDEDGHPCHTEAIESKVNNNGNNQVSVDDD